MTSVLAARDDDDLLPDFLAVVFAVVKHAGQLVLQRVVLARRRRAVDADVTDVLTQLRHCLALRHTDMF